MQQRQRKRDATGYYCPDGKAAGRREDVKFILACEARGELRYVIQNGTDKVFDISPDEWEASPSNPDFNPMGFDKSKFLDEMYSEMSQLKLAELLNTQQPNVSRLMKEPEELRLWQFLLICKKCGLEPSHYFPEVEK